VAVAGYWRTAPGQALAAIGLDPWTAVAVATHELETDHAALLAALASEAAYVGVLGSRKRIPERLGRLRADGLTEAQVLRLTAPMGLSIGARTPWEIGFSVLGEVIAALKAREARRTWPEPAAAGARRAKA
jgi:xanthine dehydrogenase accessory factor